MQLDRDANEPDLNFCSVFHGTGVQTAELWSSIQTVLFLCRSSYYTVFVGELGRRILLVINHLLYAYRTTIKVFSACEEFPCSS